jgi:TetR/AcrR family transcriptional regulator, regulator of cefoperazone and chloramphenicol sensitivity
LLRALYVRIVLYMCTAEWPAGKTLLRDTALTLFAERGPDAVSLRDVAAAAGVSPGLIVHHFGTKKALRQAVDDHVNAVATALLSSFTSTDGAAGTEMGIVAMFAEHLAGTSIIRYVQRVLASGDAGLDLFDNWYQVTLSVVRSWSEAGLLQPTDDLEGLAAFLLVNDLGAFVLRDHIAETAGIDLETLEGMQRWTRIVMTVYSHGALDPQALAKISPPANPHPSLHNDPSGEQ